MYCASPTIQNHHAKFSCLLDGIEESVAEDSDGIRNSVFVNLKRDLEILLPTHNTELHI